MGNNDSVYDCRGPPSGSNVGIGIYIIYHAQSCIGKGEVMEAVGTDEKMLEDAMEHVNKGIGILMSLYARQSDGDRANTINDITYHLWNVHEQLWELRSLEPEERKGDE